MSRPRDDGNEKVTITIARDDYERLSRLLKGLERIDSWCFINRKLGRLIFFGTIAGLVVLSQGIDAVRNIFGSLLGVLGRH